MNFSDEDLKRLKEINEANRNVEGMTVFPVIKIEALLARLEAAEVLAEWVWKWEGPTGNLKRSVEAWRKAAGK